MWMIRKLFFFLLLALPLSAQDIEKCGKRVGTIEVGKGSSAPKIDGLSNDPVWTSVKAHTIPVDIPKRILEPEDSAELKVVHDGTSVYFLLKWRDKTKSVQHKPYKWSKSRRSYEESEDLEDAAYFSFEKEGPFNVNMRAGIEAVWDAWYWQAAQTNPVGYAKDDTHHYTKKKPKRKARFIRLDTGKYGYIRRAMDEGNPIVTKSLPPARRKGTTVAQYKTQKPDGSGADVRAKGVWRSGWWTVEWSRKLDTGHSDDTAFVVGKGYGFAIGVSREAEDEDHLVSLPYTLQFK
jgi:hypothetical protein